ncbi:MAG: VWA domain-containing protein [Lachnospiraceae bacterium]|nr:VWA domain-containing protein [Lachnospiraceae bacterium]
MAVRDGIITKEELNLILLLDNSYSMVNGRIAQLNNAIPTIRNSLIRIADEECVDLKVRIIAFSDEAVWKVGTPEQGIDAASIVWKDLDVIGGTSTPKAIREANRALKKEYLGAHALRPVVILVTDGYCNPEERPDYLKAIEEMKKCLSGNTGKEKVTRIAIGVEDYNRQELVEFASMGMISDELQPLVFEIDKATDLGKVINWVAVTSMVSSMTEAEDDVIDLGDPDWGEE